MAREPRRSCDTLKKFHLLRTLALAWQKLDPSWSHSLLNFKIGWTSLGFFCEGCGLCCKTGTPKLKWNIGKDLLTSIAWTPRSPWDPCSRNVLSPVRPCSEPLRCLPDRGVPVLLYWMSGPRLSWNAVKQRSNYLLLSDEQNKDTQRHNS